MFSTASGFRASSWIAIRGAANVAAAATRAAARLVQISSYWAYLPIVRLPLDSHPRAGGPPWVRYRREAEDILQRSGAAVVNLPDFYGPNVHTSVLENALRNAVDGKPMNWIGAADVPREHVFVPDAMMRSTSPIEKRPMASVSFGQVDRSTRRRAATEHLGRDVKLRAASPGSFVWSVSSTRTCTASFRWFPITCNLCPSTPESCERFSERSKRPRTSEASERLSPGSPPRELTSNRNR